MSGYLFSASEFFDPTLGEESGRCVICGRETTKGHKIDFSDNFLGWPELEEGEVICEYCYSMARDQQYRRKSWVASQKGVRFIKRDEVLNLLLNPPEPPFSIYLTKTGKKQGFLKLVNRVNYSREHFHIALDDNLIMIDRVKLKEMVEIAQQARELKFSKAELRGDIKVKHWEHKALCEKIMEYAKNPMWEVIVYAIE